MAFKTLRNFINSTLLILTLNTVFGQNSDEKVFVNKIVIEGNVKTKSAIIFRELVFQEGDSLFKSKLTEIIKRSESNVINTNLFLTAKINLIDTLNIKTFKITVKERWYLQPFPLAYLADRSFNEWWYERGRDLKRVTYGINAKHFNLTGNQDQLSLLLLGGFTPYYELGYNRPYIDKNKRIGLKTGLFYATRRTFPFRTWNDKLDFIKTEKRMVTRYGGLVEFRLRNKLYFFHALSFAYTNYKLADTIAVLNPNYFGNAQTTQKLFTINYEYKYDKRDNSPYALTGNYFYTDLTSYFGNNNYKQVGIRASHYHFAKLHKNLYFDIKNKLKISSPREQYYFTTAGLGYSSSLVRGYELFVIDGQHFALQRATLKYKVFERTFNLKKLIKLSQFSSLPIAIYPNVFVDNAYVRNYNVTWSNSKLSNTWLSGQGIGVDIVTWYSTVLKAYYARNGLGQYQFFFGIGTSN